MLYIDMVDWVLRSAKGCPEDDAADAMRNACMEFCTETRFMTEGTDVVTDGSDVELDAGLDRQVVDVIEARISGEAEPMLVTYMNDPRLDELCDGEYALIFADPGLAQLVPAATVAAPITLELLLCYAPGPESAEVPDLLWLRHSETLKSGALYRLLAEPGKAWSNPQIAEYHRLRFEKAMASTAAELGRNRLTTARRLRVQPV